MNADTILSYFLKDIKVLNEEANYSVYIDRHKNISIYHYNRIIYSNHTSSKTINNYKTNVFKKTDFYLRNNKLFIDYQSKQKTLYITDWKYAMNDSIMYSYELKKYLLKYYVRYFFKYTVMLKIKIIYYNLHKYKYKYKINKDNNTKKFISILFTNKYELNYINTFFRLYFDIYLAILIIHN